MTPQRPQPSMLDEQAPSLISPRDRVRLMFIMKPETIYVSPLSLVEATVADASVGHLVTLIITTR